MEVRFWEMVGQSQLEDVLDSVLLFLMEPAGTGSVFAAATRLTLLAYS